MEEIVKELGNKIDAYKNETVSKSEYDTLKGELEALKAVNVEKSIVDALSAKLDELALEVKEAEGQRAKNSNGLAELEKGLAENAEAILKQKTSGTIANFVIKDVAPILTTNVSHSGGGSVVAMTENTGALYATPDNRLFAEGIMDRMTVDLDSIVYIDEVAGEGDAGMTAEGNTKSQSDTDYVERTLNLQNVTHFIKVSTKMLRQPAYIVQAVRNTLLRKLELKKQSQLLSGDGSAPDIKGIKEWATAFTAGGFADSVIEPNVNDLIRVVVAKISENADDFVPNYVILSHKTLADMDLKKASDGHYTLPPFSTLDNRVVAGVRVIASNEFTDDELLVGDFTKAHYVSNSNIQVSVNLDGNDFTKNLRTILAEQAIGLYVSSNETGAFILVDDIAQALADITLPEPSV
jgi:HK97 family phage major capsid protein